MHLTTQVSWPLPSVQVLTFVDSPFSGVKRFITGGVKSFIFSSLNEYKVCCMINFSLSTCKPVNFI
jgi:hypothetical protein